MWKAQRVCMRPASALLVVWQGAPEPLLQLSVLQLAQHAPGAHSRNHAQHVLELFEGLWRLVQALVETRYVGQHDLRSSTHSCWDHATIA